jgi:hypothetical protein
MDAHQNDADAERFAATAQQFETLAQHMNSERAKESLLDAARYWRSRSEQVKRRGRTPG